MVRHFCLAALLITLAGAASARDEGEGGNGNNSGGEGEHSGHSLRAPEIDPASAMASLTMLAGGLAVLRGRRREPSQK
jgi:hypothetical protein